jgi:hypothetical protein
MPQSTVTWYPDRKDIVSWNVREVMLDFAEVPHLTVRLELTGVRFAHRALEPFMRVGDVQSRLVLIDPDEQVARGYFDRPLPDGAQIVFGYGDQVVLVIRGKFQSKALKRLDRERLPKGTRLYDRPARGGEGPR